MGTSTPLTTNMIVKISIYNVLGTLENQVSMSSLPIILIFPISVLSDVSETKAFGPAITESMISSLSKFGGISVMSSSASFHAENLEFTDEEIQKNFISYFNFKS